jgi:hypothetical protein
MILASKVPAENSTFVDLRLMLIKFTEKRRMCNSCCVDLPRIGEDHIARNCGNLKSLYLPSTSSIIHLHLPSFKNQPIMPIKRQWALQLLQL